jgi:transposase
MKLYQRGRSTGERRKQQEADMNYCGIDLASKASAICIMNIKGEISEEFEIPTDEDGIRTRLGKLEPMRCVIEASPLAEWMARQVESYQHEAVIIDPRRAKAVVCTKKKTDRVNAQDLGHMGRTGWYTEVHRKSEQARLMRTYLSAHQGLKETAKAQNARIRGLLRAHGIKVGRVSEKEFALRIRELVKARAPFLQAILTPLLQLWGQAVEEAKKMKKTIAASAKKDPLCRLLMSAPGVGPMTASAYVATIDDPHRFSRSDQVGAYLGIVPRVYQSGDTCYLGRITKEGDRLLRWLLVEASHSLLTNTKRKCALKSWGLQLQEKKGVGKAKVAVARKLAVILHRMWITGEKFDWQRI